MAPRVIFFLRSLVLLYLANTSHSFQSVIHRIWKDNVTSTYSIPISIGDDFLPAHLFVLDLNGVAPLLQNCATAFKSPDFRTIRCGSTRCTYANPNFSCPNDTTSTSTTKRKKTQCRSSDNARLFRDTVMLLYSYDGLYIFDSQMRSSLTLTCTDGGPFKGSIGLANTHLSIPSQLVSMFKLSPKMALCLPSTKSHHPGDFWIGKGEYHYPPYSKDVSKIFASTPLIGNVKSGRDYLIDVKSIQIGRKTVPILHGATKISTLAPYTVLQTSFYTALLTSFAKIMPKAPAVKPFGACFRSINGGRGVPVIHLVLRGGAVWRIYGSNSLVKVSKNVSCFGFVDGGANPKNPIVIGGFQMEDNLVEFDLEASIFSFSSSLLLHNTSCSVRRYDLF